MNHCVKCGVPVLSEALLCSNCGHFPPPPADDRLITRWARVDVALGLLTIVACVGLFFFPLLFLTDHYILGSILIVAAGYIGPIAVWLLYLVFRKRRQAFARGLRYGLYVQLVVLLGALVVCLPNL